jgi:hypothetical protein
MHSSLGYLTSVEYEQKHKHADEKALHFIEVRSVHDCLDKAMWVVRTAHVTIRKSVGMLLHVGL